MYNPWAVWVFFKAKIYLTIVKSLKKTTNELPVIELCELYLTTQPCTHIWVKYPSFSTSSGIHIPTSLFVKGKSQYNSTSGSEFEWGAFLHYGHLSSRLYTQKNQMYTPTPTILTIFVNFIRKTSMRSPLPTCATIILCFLFLLHSQVMSY